MPVAIYLPTLQLAHIRATLGNRGDMHYARSWEHLETMIRHERINAVIFSPAANGIMDAPSVFKIVSTYPSIPFIAYVPLEPGIVREVLHLVKLGVEEVVFYRYDDTTTCFENTLERVNSIAPIASMVLRLDPWLRGLPKAVIEVLEDCLRNPQKYSSAEDIAAASHITISALYRRFRFVRLNSPKSFVVGARVFRGCLYLKDAGFAIADIAAKVGYRHPRIFADHTTTILGKKPSKVRISLGPIEIENRLLAWLTAGE